jgi:hypothetical protein
VDEDSPWRTRSYLWIGAFVALGLAVLAGLALLLTRPSRLATPEGVAEAYEQNSAMRETLAALRVHYPAEHRAMLARVAAAVRESGPRAGSRAGYLFLQNLLVAKGNAIASAPDRQLVRLAGLQAELAQSLRDRDVALCARFAVSDLGQQARLSPDLERLLGRLSAAQIMAARLGETSGRRPRPPLSEADGGALLAQIRSVDSGAARMIEDGSIARASPAQQCHAGVILYRAIADLPPAISANVMAALILQNMRSRAR